jgi:SSS family solute:Na+ symporter
VIALILGFYAGQLIFWLVLFAWAGLGASIGTTSILALYWKGVSRLGVIAGMITGTLTVVIWNRVAVLKEVVYELIPGFFIAFIVTVLVSLFTGHRNDSFDK